jgi:hypothetical protein
MILDLAMRQTDTVFPYTNTRPPRGGGKLRSLYVANNTRFVSHLMAKPRYRRSIHGARTTAFFLAPPEESGIV